MMLPFLFLFCLPAVVDVSLAPDQPVPFVYCDDPLILEIHAPRDVQVSGFLLFKPNYNDKRIEVAIEPFTMPANSGYWYVVSDAPGERGFFSVDIKLDCGNETLEKTLRYCRIDRPAFLHNIPVFVHCGGDEGSCSLVSIRSVGIDTLHFAAGNTSLESLTDEAVRLGLHFMISLSPDELRDVPAYLKDFASARCEHILRFECGCESIESECCGLMENFRTTVCPASMALVVKDANAFSKLLGDTSRMPARHVSLVSDTWPRPEEVQRIRYIAAQYGQESQQIHVSCPSWFPRSNEQAATLLPRFFQYRAAAASQIGVNAALIADDVAVQETMAYLNGLALFFSGQCYVGSPTGQDGVNSLLFRKGAQWLTVLWSDKKGSTATFAVDGAINLALYDAFGNAMKLDEPGQRGLEVPCGPIPVYLTGTGGALLGRAAVNRLKQQIDFFMAQSDLRENLTPDVIERIQKIGAEPRSDANRLRFLELARTLPWIEEQWHSRGLSRHVAVPAIMLISDILKTMAIIEEDRGELFLEPVSDTLGRTEEFQSLYLTGSAGSAKARERGDWVLGEVRRLVEDAESLEQAGRKIEAAGIAALAEARAQCLKAAARAEVTNESAELVPLPLTPAVETPVPEAETAETGALVPEAPKPDVPAQDKDKDTAKAKAESTPVKEEKAAEEAAPAKKDTPKETRADDTVHVVVSGDNPYAIAKKYGVKLADLLEVNNLTSKSILKINQELIIPKSKSD
ncbi:MAG: LysM peptidoglycan-binding domain-containing protein [Candidatus Hydrogenedentales bacterium]|jgi:LysM repeat protein